jgi:hypothetical protein
MTKTTVVATVLGLLALCGAVLLFDAWATSDCTNRGGHVQPSIVSRIGWFCEGAAP